MKGKRLAAGIIVILVITAAVVTFFLVRSHQESKKGGATVPSSTLTAPLSIAPSPPLPDMSQVAAALNGRNVGAKKMYLPSEFQNAIWNPEDVVPNGETLVVNQASCGSSGVVGWCIGKYKLANGAVESEVIIHMEYQNSHWVIVTFEGK